MTPGTGLPGLAECRDCHEPIRFVRMTVSGRAMPVNPAPNPEGIVAARLRGPSLTGHVISAEHPHTDAYPYRFTPHWYSCTRRPAPAPAPPPDPQPGLF